MGSIEPFAADLGSLRSVRFQWALHQFRKADECRRREDAQRQAIRTPRDLERFGEKVRDHVSTYIGGLPDLPVSVPHEVVRELTFDGVRIQVFVLESLPRFKAPGLVYFPAQETPGPGIFIASGHFEDSKTHDDYQRLARELARNGFTVLIIDWMGLGERKSWLNPDGTVFRSGSREHNYMGLPCHLAGFNIARYMIHDARCAISVLAGLPTVDPSRIAVTGHSGGGLMTTYLALFEERIVAAAPVTFLCDRYRHMHTALGNDAEFATFGVMKHGINSADFMASFVPKPVFTGAVESDIFPADGFMLEVERLQRMFDVAGRSDNFEYLITAGRHSYPEPIRNATIRFFARHLSPTGAGRELSVEGLQLRSDAQIPLQPAEGLWVVPSGLIYAEEPSMPRPNDLNRQAFDNLPRPAVPPARYPEVLAELLALDPAAIAADPLHATQLREGPLPGGELRYCSIVSEPGVELGCIVLAPRAPAGGAQLYLGDAGANDAVTKQEMALAQLERGYFVLFGDVRGRGAVEADLVNGRDRYDHYGTEHWFACVSDMMGLSVAAQRTRDALRWLAFLEHHGFPVDRVHIRGEGQTGLAALFAAALTGRPCSFDWENPLPDWDDVIHSRDYDRTRFNEAVAVFRIARHFTLRELLSYIGA